MRHSAARSETSFLHRAFDWVLDEVRHVIPPTIFFLIGFTLIAWTKELILEERGISFNGFAGAAVAALLVGKAVLITDALPLMRRFEGAPLIQPILFKTGIYCLCAFLVRIAERLIEFHLDGGAIADFSAYMINNFSWPRFIFIQIWVMVLFLAFVTIHELNTLFGDGELYRLFFRWRSSQVKHTRRMRIRMLTRLNQITERNPNIFDQRGSTKYNELVAILRELASPPTHRS